MKHRPTTMSRPSSPTRRQLRRRGRVERGVRCAAREQIERADAQRRTDAAFTGRR